MSIRVLELNDLGLTLHEADRTHALGAAAAAGQGKKLVFGQEALDVSRVSPQEFNNRYIGALNAQPLAARMGPAQNHADLVYHHLNAMDLGVEPLVIAVPSHFKNDQLGLLLGICQELSLEVRGFLDIPLAHALTAPSEQPFSVLDIELHRFSITHYEPVHDGETDKLTQVDNKVWDGRGVAHLLEGWMSSIADEFVQHTRFDPLHAGNTEQQLFAQTWGFLGTTLGDRVRIAIEANNDTRDLEIPRTLLIQKLHQRLEGIDLTGVQNLALTHRVQAIPGLDQWAEDLGFNVTNLDANDALTTAMQQTASALPEGQVIRLTAAEAAIDRTENVSQTSDSTETSDQPATHLLLDNVAKPVGDVHCAPGETIVVDGLTYTAIRVEH